jgi:oligopeptide/dipeptide ABC transporter ATP-binding protein
VQNEPLLSVRNLCKYFPIAGKGFFNKIESIAKAVDDVNFDLYPGQTLGLVGESGSGKTTTARSILRAITPTRGVVNFRVDGKVVDLAKLSNRELKPLRTKMQMIFQDPFSSLNPRMSVRDIIGEPLLIHNIAKGGEMDDRIVDILQKVGLKKDHLFRYPHAFSGGQRQRIGIARSLILKPSLIIADEAVSALDVSVQAQVINLLEDLQEEFKLTYIFVAHDLSVIRHICDRVAVMYAGRIIELADSEDLFLKPKHPYSKALLAAIPHPDPDIPMNFDLSGEVADPANLPKGCAFCPRCPEKMSGICEQQVPALIESEPGRFTACHLFKSV